MKRNELWLGCLLAVAGFFGACTNVVEDESQNNKYPMELMAEKSAITFTRSIGEKTEWDGGELVSYTMVSHKSCMRFLNQEK